MRNFNPRPREEGDQWDSHIKKMTDEISIHALVKRATTMRFKLYLAGVISIHALVKRATSALALRGKNEDNFNPRPREEGDPHPNYKNFNSIISIHALVKRATLRQHGYISGEYDFNPRPREEGDRSAHSHALRMEISIHALVKRATIFSISFSTGSLFQSTPS